MASIEELERRVQELEDEQGRLGKKRVEIREARKEFRKKRRLYFIIGRILALIVAYPFIAGLLWSVGSQRPFLHALAPAITIFAYLFVTPRIQNMLLSRYQNAQSDNEEEADRDPLTS